MTRDEAKDFLTKISYALGNMSVEYLTEKDGEKMREAIEVLEKEQETYTNIPFLLHKESGCPLDECIKAYEKANEYLMNKSKVKG